MYNTAEKETIGLCVSIEALRNIINYELLELKDVSEYPGEVEVYFHAPSHRDLFMIRLLDFVKEVGDKKLTGVSGSCLDVLKAACTSCSFDLDDSIGDLRESVNNLDEWLHSSSPIELWLPTLDINAHIKVSRLELIEISGNQCKHNLSRLTRISEKIHSILDSNGYSILSDHIPFVLEEFQEHLSGSFFIYYGTLLGELLNNLYWGIQNYLQPTFTTSYSKDNPNDILYQYEYPDNIKHEIPRQWFWRLMNNIRKKPVFNRFKGAHYLKKQSVLERYAKQNED